MKSQTKFKGKASAAAILELWNQALRKFRKKDYLSVSGMLEEFLTRESEHLPALKLMGFALILTGQMAEAKRHFLRAMRLNRNDVEVLDALAYIELSEKNLQAAINHLLDALYIEEDNELLKNNLELLRGGQEVGVLFSRIKAPDFLLIRLPEQTWLDQVAENLGEFFRSPRAKLLLGAFALLILIIGTIHWYPDISNLVEDYRMNRGLGQSYRNVTIQDIDKLVKERKRYKIRLDSEAIKRKYAMVRQYLEMQKRNRAILMMNELLHSNAPEETKEHVRIMQSFIPDPDPNRIDYNPSYRDVVRAPFLYQDIYVKWNGTVVNLEHLERKETSFDLLINFVNDAVVEGIAQPHFKGFLKIRNGDKVAVYGRIAGLTLDNKVILLGDRVVSLEGK